jgi:hypothetical protein
MPRIRVAFEMSAEDVTAYWADVYGAGGPARGLKRGFKDLLVDNLTSLVDELADEVGVDLWFKILEEK